MIELRSLTRDGFNDRWMTMAVHRSPNRTGRVKNALGMRIDQIVAFAPHEFARSHIEAVHLREGQPQAARGSPKHGLTFRRRSGAPSKDGLPQAGNLAAV